MQASTTKSSKKVPLFFYTLYIEGEGSEGSGEGEVIVRVNIADVNDNAPRFEAEGAEIVASVPTTAQYGHHVTRIQVICCCMSCLVTPLSYLPRHLSSQIRMTSVSRSCRSTIHYLLSTAFSSQIFHFHGSLHTLNRVPCRAHNSLTEGLLLTSC